MYTRFIPPTHTCSVAQPCPSLKKKKCFMFSRMNEESICSMFYHLELIHDKLLSSLFSQIFCTSNSSLEKSTSFQ